MSHQCILIIGMEPERENQLQREWFRSRLKVPLVFRRTAQGAFNYLNAARQNTDFYHSCPAMLVIDWHVADIPASVAVKEVRSQPRLRELLIIALNKQWSLMEERMAYTTGVDTCVECPGGFGELLDRLRKIEEYWFPPVNTEEQFAHH